MSGVVGLLIKLGVRFVVFGAVFVLAAWKTEKVTFHKKWAAPLIALVFATLNTALYWVLAPVLDLATLGALGFVMPLIVNVVLLYVTVKLFERKQWVELGGVFAMLWMAAILTVAHGALWFGLDYLPSR